MDETGQPGGEPAGVSGNGAHSKGQPRLDANGWQQPDTEASPVDGAHGEALPAGSAPPGPVHADGAWSAGSREPAMEPIPSWRRSAVTQLTDRPDQPRRLSDLLAPVSPPVPPPFPFEGGPGGSFDGTNGPVGQPGAAEPQPRPPVAGTAVNGSADFYGERPVPHDGHRRDGRELDGHYYDDRQYDARQNEVRPPWAPHPPQVAGPAPVSDRFGEFGGYLTGPGPDATLDDLPVPGPATASHVAYVDDARQEPTWPEPTWPSHGRAVDEPGWAVPASGEPLPVPGAPRAVTHPDDAPRYNGSAPVSPAVPFRPAPSRPGPTPPYPGQPHAAVPSHVDSPHTGPVSARSEPEHRQEAADRQVAVPRPDAPIQLNGAARPEALTRSDLPIRPDATGPGPLSRVDDPLRPERALAEPVPARDPVLDDPWADPARYAAAYRESMSAIRAASVGVAAAQAMAAAEDRAAVQAAYTAAVDASHAADPVGRGDAGDAAAPDQPHHPHQPYRSDPAVRPGAANQPARAGLSLSEQTRLAAALGEPAAADPGHAGPSHPAPAHPATASAPAHPEAGSARPAPAHPVAAPAQAHAAAAPAHPIAPVHHAAAATQVHPAVQPTVRGRAATGPISPTTPLGQPSLADYRERPRPADTPSPGDGDAPRPRDILIPRQPGPTDQGVPVGQPVRSVPMSQPVPMGHGSPHGQAASSTPPGSAARGGQPDPSGQPGHEGSALPVPPVLPQRVPAAPDVPEVPEDLADEDFVDHGPDLVAVNQPELARIATGLRYNEDLEEPPRPDGFDTLAVLAAVRAVPGVRDAQLRPSPTGGGVHTLRLDLADGADGAQVSRLVARLLKQRMGLAAEPRRSAEPRRAPVVSPAPNTGQPHRDPGAMPVAGTAPSPRIPVPTSAAEQLGGPVASNATDDRTRRRPVPAARGRDIESTEPHRVIRSAAGPRVVIDQVQVSTLGLDATVEVRLTSGGTPAIGVASGPAVDGYVLRLAAVAATAALDQLLATVDSWEQPGRCFVEHAAVVPFGSIDVAVVVVLLVCGSSAEQLTGSALVAGDPRQAVVRATLAAMNRRLDTLLS